MSKHTPGPWIVNGDAIEGVEENGSGIYIAHVADPSDNGPAQYEANARLIAAAPEMAALLLLAWQHVSHGGPKRGEVEDVLRKAGLLR